MRHMQVIERIAFSLWYADYVLAELGGSLGDDFDRLSRKWQEDMLPFRNENHRGDCLNLPMGCRRCEVDMLFTLARVIMTEEYSIPQTQVQTVRKTLSMLTPTGLVCFILLVMLALFGLLLLPWYFFLAEVGQQG